MKSFAVGPAPEHIVYKQADGRSLSVDVFKASNPPAGKPGACAVLFHGSVLGSGNPASMFPIAEALAGWGMTAMSVEFRGTNRQNTSDASPIIDAKSAMRWVRSNAARFGCAPDRIAASGRSSGGTLALLTTLTAEFDDPKDPALSAAANALVLLNPGVNPVENFNSAAPADVRVRISPFHLLDKARLPPTLILHGTADKVTPYADVVAFKDKALKLGNPDVTLISFQGRGHGFFKQNKRDGEDFNASIDAMNSFFKRLGWIN